MKEERFIITNKAARNIPRAFLENIAVRTFGAKIPPYWRFNPSTQAQVEGGDYSVEIRPPQADIDPETLSIIDGLDDEKLADMVRANALGIPMQMPMTLKIEGWKKGWLLPYEPIVSVTGQNIITRRNVSKGRTRGSVKERWAQDDYSITVNGILIGENKYPEDDVKKLIKICERAKVEVYSPLLYMFGINYMVIDSYDFPNTEGANNQEYSLKCYSDETYKLLLKKIDLK